ncbi:hypothetical protein VB712_09600 [Spirulina sp. CCNP1310]|uniref:hypothetical protein n=1 Tax=Spirulina sp. CCNP1310 TaxID=3110249 RepID=UPI002B20694D|nr:hypothetical protein [Spirulina sp. CCNP1310]MEA5419480.1 hypothetical protein [Spirulina sp. CCNP1310]
MSSNNYLPHLVILPEDEADAKIAHGFTLNLQINQRAIQVLPYAGGWKVVVGKFIKDHATKMRQYLERRFLLLIDFDKQLQNRLPYIQNQIPENVRDRVFILGVFSKPEKLGSALGKKLESIGEEIADNCEQNSNQFWQHDLLKHNQAELERMIADVKPFLFAHGKA